ncbi:MULTISPECIES: hypothetical protein [Streptomyces]|uniref:hypothetical protein n=1 Tax=Streptomyces TaxID=1883 RepID=UPI003667D99A
MKTRKPVGRAAIAAAALALPLTACGGSRDYAVPKQVCGVPLDSGLLSPLLSSGERLSQDKYDTGRESPRCRLDVDKQTVVYLKGDVIDTKTDPIEVNNQLLQRLGNPTPVAVGEGGRVADSGAIAFANCTYQGKPQRFVAYVELSKPVPEKTSERRDALVAFLRAYLPAAMKAQGCTRP